MSMSCSNWHPASSRKLRSTESTDAAGTISVSSPNCSRWQSMDAVRAFAGADPDRAVIEPGAKAVLAEYDDFVTHYEVTLEAMGA